MRTRSPLPDFTSTFADRAIVARQCRRGLIPAHRLKVRANKKYLLAIIEKIGLKKLNEIDQALMGWLAEQIYPGRTAATINRQLYTPVIAVMKFARHAYQLKRPEGHDNLPALDVPANDWYPAVVRAANPYLRAFLMVQRMTGRRPDELLNRTRDHYVRETGALMVWDGKGKQFISLELPALARIALDALPDLREVPKRAGSRRAKSSPSPSERSCSGRTTSQRRRAVAANWAS